MTPGKSKPDPLQSAEDPEPPDARLTSPLSRQDSQALEKIFVCLFNAFKIDFSHYRHSTIIRRLSRRMGLSKNNNYADYLDYLETHPDEIELLYDDLLLSVTRFFRDSHIFDTLREKVFPQLFRNRSVKTPVRIWVPGCSTGEEVYSLAICLHEYQEETRTKVPIQFFGTDLVQRHIIRARAGIYPDKIREEISPERLERFFDHTAQGLKVIKHIREMCVFAVQDIVHDPPFPNIDLISCRNVLIYFDAAFQETVIPLFYFSLKSSGYLLLGSSETMGKFPQYFNIVDPKTNLFSKRMSGTKPAFRFPIQPGISKLKGITEPGLSKDSYRSGAAKMNPQIMDTLLDTYAPPGVFVDSNMQIQQFIGRTFPYLESGSGQASLKLTRMTGNGMMPDIYVAIEEARKKQTKIKKKNIRFKQEDRIITADLCVIPVQDPNTNENGFLIMFETPEPPQPSGTPADSQSNAADDMLEQIKQELESSNEELIALNEELFTKNMELNTAKEFAENLVETASTMIITLDGDALITTFNQYAEKLTGYLKEEVLGKNWFEYFIPESDRKNIPTVFKEALKNMPDASQHENPIVIKDGSHRLIRWRNNILTNNLGNISGVLSIGTDITEYRQAKKALRESEARFKNYIESAPDGIFVTDESGRYIDVNEAACRITGYRREELLNMTFAELVPPGELETAKKHFNTVLRSGSASRELPFLTRDKTVRYWMVEAVKLSDKRFLGFAKDTTENRQIEEQLRQAAKMEAIGQLAGGIAHDFNNILHMIIGNTELMMDDVPETSPIHTNLEEIKTAGLRAAGIVKQLLNFSRKTALRLIPVDAATVVKDSLQFLRSSIPKTIDIKADIQTIDISILADPIQINQVMMNICTNAFQAMKKTGGTLTIQAIETQVTRELAEKVPDLSEGNYVKITIQDTGPGIDPGIINRIFDPYFTTKGFGKGSGMGLAVVQGIVKTHKGAVTVESPPGRGTIFTLFFPVSEKKQAAEIKSEGKLPRGSESILFVDDEEPITAMAGKMLTRLGYRVEPKLYPQQAIKAFQQNPAQFDLVITDMTMPQMTGVTLSEMLKTIRPDIPIIICTGHSSLIDKEKALQLGIAAYLMKPVSMRDMAKTIRTVLDARS